MSQNTEAIFLLADCRVFTRFGGFRPFVSIQLTIFLTLKYNDESTFHPLLGTAAKNRLYLEQTVLGIINSLLVLLHCGETWYQLGKKNVHTQSVMHSVGQSALCSPTLLYDRT